MEGLKSGPNTLKNQESYDINGTLENTGSGIAIRLSVIESKNYGLVPDLLAPNRSTEKSYAEITENQMKLFNATNFIHAAGKQVNLAQPLKRI